VGAALKNTCPNEGELGAFRCCSLFDRDPARSSLLYEVIRGNEKDETGGESEKLRHVRA